MEKFNIAFLENLSYVQSSIQRLSDFYSFCSLLNESCFIKKPFNVYFQINEFIPL